MTDEYQELEQSQKERRNKHQTLLDDTKKVMETVQGRRFIYHLLSEAGVYRLSFDQASDRKTAFNEGRRYTGLQLIDLLEEANVGLFSQMLNENRIPHGQRRN